MPTFYRSEALVAAVESRLRKVLNMPIGGYVMLSLPPDDKPVYRATEGLTYYISGPKINPTSGAGRHGLKLSRILHVDIHTVCNLGQAGDDKPAALKHYALEDKVLDALMDDNPVLADNTFPVGILLNPVGGSDIYRGIGQDVGRFTSRLDFEIQYSAAVKARGD